MKTIILKFGGASVASPSHFSRIAEIVLATKRRFSRVVIVVSAMGETTDQLIRLAHEVNPNPPKREYDMLVSVGERISISLLAMALAAKGENAVSFTGSQSGIITCSRHSEAKIIAMRPSRLEEALDRGKIVIVAGFQGVSVEKEITTLGRGGSDTTAVALGVALGAECVAFYKDVLGIYTADPKIDPDAKLMPHLTYQECLTLLGPDAEVLHPRAVQLAMKNGIPLKVSSFLTEGGGTAIEAAEPRGREMVYEEAC
ncbi:MAG: aspartate kinase [Chlamydiia bacterium]|nr:aspartate kinase [Chlamydiia bacterium]